MLIQFFIESLSLLHKENQCTEEDFSRLSKSYGELLSIFEARRKQEALQNENNKTPRMKKSRRSQNKQMSLDEGLDLYEENGQLKRNILMLQEEKTQIEQQYRQLKEQVNKEAQYLQKTCQQEN